MLEAAPSDRGEELGFLTRPQVVGGLWPAPLLERLKERLGSRTLLLVGRTDATGPKALNQALGLQYAAEAARGLATALRLDTARLACASAGEDPTAEPGVILYGWNAPQRRRGASRLTVLEPGRDVGPQGRLWAIWDRAASDVLWRPGGECDALNWSLDASAGSLVLPYPGRCRQGLLGAAFSPDELPVAAVNTSPAGEDPDLGLVLEERDAWTARYAGVLPRTTARAVVWAGGVPYPVRPAADGTFAADVALLPDRARAYVQLVGSDGRVAVGPQVELPPGEGEVPGLLAVLVWDSADADLDLHALAGPKHTSPQDPDPRLSDSAVPGARLLFDGNAERPASALAVAEGAPAEVEVRWYSALADAEATAWLYLFEFPGDRLLRQGRILGPRRLTGDPLAARWPALLWKGR